MGSEHHSVRLFQNGLGGHNLTGDIQAVAVLLHHLQNPIDLAPGGFEQAVHLGMVSLH